MYVIESSKTNNETEKMSKQYKINTGGGYMAKSQKNQQPTV